jgi:hypothetical protein
MLEKRDVDKFSYLPIYLVAISYFTIQLMNQISKIKLSKRN